MMNYLLDTNIVLIYAQNSPLIKALQKKYDLLYEYIVRNSHF